MTPLAAWTDRPPVAVALDAPDVATALDWARAVAPHVAVLKIGLELFYRAGPAVVEAVRALPEADGVAIFLDLKLHDIPNTVAGGVASAARLGPRFLTVHAAGGAAMVRAAADAAASVDPGLEITGVTVLTSLGSAELDAIGLVGPPADAARRLAVLAVHAGARALVCSPKEVSGVRAEVGPDVTLITPGVRPAGSQAHDQARVATPEQAISDGADLLVIGRPITRAADAGAAAAAVAALCASR
ncbi:MAG: orotidine-5'-phosphate decarboxylase [Frankia sp.]